MVGYISLLLTATPFHIGNAKNGGFSAGMMVSTAFELNFRSFPFSGKNRASGKGKELNVVLQDERATGQ